MIKNNNYNYLGKEFEAVGKAEVNTETKQVSLHLTLDNISMPQLTTVFNMPNFDRNGNLLEQGYTTVKANGHTPIYDELGEIIGGWEDYFVEEPRGEV